MNKNDRNIIMITAGGIGSRFGSNIPKQYVEINGRPVISYVIEACKKSRLADAILVVADSRYHSFLKENYNVDVCQSGDELNITKRNGFEYIYNNSNCVKLVVVESARPTVKAEVIDQTFKLLDKYDAVACARKIIDSLGHYGEWIVNREDYYTLNPPEGFCFKLLYNNFNKNSKLTETIQQLPENSKVFLNFDVPYFEKITYRDDINRIKGDLT